MAYLFKLIVVILMIIFVVPFLLIVEIIAPFFTILGIFEIGIIYGYALKIN